MSIFDSLVYEVQDIEAIKLQEPIITAVICRYNFYTSPEDYTIQFASQQLNGYVGPIHIPEIPNPEIKSIKERLNR